MKTSFKTLLFSSTPFPSPYISSLSLLLRLVIGFAMLSHGIPKIFSFEELALTFPDPIGLGSRLSLLLAICAEVTCSILLIMGLFTRIAALTLIFNMSVIVFVVFNASAFSAKEIGVLYLIIYIAIFTLSAGKYSLDHLLYKKLWNKSK